MNKKYAYESRIVCFIDILGFSNLIKSTTDKSNEGVKNLNNICQALNLIDIFRKIMSEKLPIEDVKTTQFSDSLVISFPWNENNNSILTAFMTIKYMQIYLIKEYNMLMRGGIVIGDVIHDDQLIVGPAMIAAYQLESKCAVSPRIVIDPKVSYRYKKVLKKQSESEWSDNNIIHKDSDDTSYIDYFNFDPKDNMFSGQEKLDYFKQLCKIVAVNVESSDMSIRIKYLWMRNKIKGSTLYKQPDYAAAYKEIVTNKNKSSKTK